MMKKEAICKLVSLRMAPIKIHSLFMVYLELPAFVMKTGNSLSQVQLQPLTRC